MSLFASGFFAASWISCIILPFTLMFSSASGKGSLAGSSSVPDASASKAAGVKNKVSRTHPWILKPYEVEPICFMNKYVESDYHRISHAELWKRLDQKTRKDGLYHSELCAQSAEHRYEGLMRFVQNLTTYCEVMQDPRGFYCDFAGRMLTEEYHRRLYNEISDMHPIFKYLSVESRLPGHNLDRDRVLKFCSWARSHSFLRTFIQWQARAGLSHHLMSHFCTAHAFLAVGNSPVRIPIVKEKLGTDSLRHLSSFWSMRRIRPRLHQRDFGPCGIANHRPPGWPSEATRAASQTSMAQGATARPTMNTKGAT